MTALPLTTADAARAEFAPVDMGTPDALSEAASRRFDLDRGIKSYEAKRESLVARKARSSVVKTLAWFDGQIAEVDEMIDLLTAQLESAVREYETLRNERDVHSFNVQAMVTADLLAKYGDVQWTEAEDGGPARPLAVEFISRTGDLFAIVSRGNYRFEVGLRGDASRYFVFGMDVDVYGPDRGYITNGKVSGRRASLVNWGSHGSSVPSNARQYAAALDIAADLAEAVNNLLGIPEGTDAY